MSAEVLPFHPSGPVCWQTQTLDSAIAASRASYLSSTDWGISSAGYSESQAGKNRLGIEAGCSTMPEHVLRSKKKFEQTVLLVDEALPLLHSLSDKSGRVRALHTRGRALHARSTSYG